MKDLSLGQLFCLIGILGGLIYLIEKLSHWLF
jgi:hypothetical protein